MGMKENINLIQMFNAFDSWSILNNLSTNERSLFITVLQIWNRCGRQEWISVANSEMQKYSGISNLKTLQNVRLSLERKSLLFVKKGKKNKEAPKYSITQVNSALVEIILIGSNKQDLTNTSTNTLTNTSTNTSTNTLTNNVTNTLDSDSKELDLFDGINLTNTSTNTNTNTSTNTLTNTSTTYTEKELEKELEKDKKEYIQTEDRIDYKSIIEHLNKVAGTNYKPNSKAAKKAIKARIEDGFEVDDFKKVIDNKFASWKGTRFENYMRPTTLFSGKFEEYLNEKPLNPKQQEERPAWFTTMTAEDEERVANNPEYQI